MLIIPISVAGSRRTYLSLASDTHTSYSYFDECFGINVDFNRKSYTEDNLKPQDTLTIMFSFKNVGSYRSTNLAVSETDKQDIECTRCHAKCLTYRISRRGGAKTRIAKVQRWARPGVQRTKQLRRVWTKALLRQ